MPELEGEPDQVDACACCNSSRQPTAALKFARYLTARDRGLPVFQQFGLQPVDGDVWEERPEINFFCGAVNRRAVEQIVADFQQREDVGGQHDLRRLRHPDRPHEDHRRPGSAGQGFPDVYMACDVYYLENVKEWFQEAVNVSDTDIVIAVPKGSTKVRALADLVKPGVRVAVGEPDQCTIGALTRRLLAKEGLYEQLEGETAAAGRGRGREILVGLAGAGRGDRPRRRRGGLHHRRARPIATGWTWSGSSRR